MVQNKCPLLYRGKSCNTGEWIEGNGIHYPSSHAWEGTCWINGMSDRANDWVQVKPETVGVWTSAVDELGNNVFEGDILDYGDPDEDVKGIVEFRNCGFVVVWYGNKSYVDESGHMADGDWQEIEINTFEQVYVETCKIVGNIYDNSDLIKG